MKSICSPKRPSVPQLTNSTVPLLPEEADDVSFVTDVSVSVLSLVLDGPEVDGLDVGEGTWNARKDCLKRSRTTSSSVPFPQFPPVPFKPEDSVPFKPEDSVPFKPEDEVEKEDGEDSMIPIRTWNEGVIVHSIVAEVLGIVDGLLVDGLVDGLGGIVLVLDTFFTFWIIMDIILFIFYLCIL